MIIVPHSVSPLYAYTWIISVVASKQLSGLCFDVNTGKKKRKEKVKNPAWQLFQVSFSIKQPLFAMIHIIKASLKSTAGFVF